MDPHAFYGLEASAVIDVARTFADASHSPSCGEVTSNELLNGRGTPKRDGALSERIFGPLERLRCRCGATQGEASAGVVCPRCGVLSGDPSERGRRWGHVVLASPLVHPAVVPLIASLLDASEESVLAVARHEAWCHEGEIYSPPGYTPSRAPGVPFWEWEPEVVGELDPGLRELYRINQVLRRLGSLPAWAEKHFSDEAAWYDEALGGCGGAGLRVALEGVSVERRAAFERAHGFAPRDLLLTTLPISPPDARPFAARPGGILDPGPLNRKIAKLVWMNRMLRQLLESDQGVLSVRTQEQILQLELEGLVAKIRGEEPAPARVEITSAIRAPELEERINVEHLEDPKPGLLRQVVSLAIAADTAMVSLPTATFFVRLDSGRIESAVTAPNLRVVGADADASHAVFLHLTRMSMHVFEIARRRWCTERPGFVRCAIDSVQEGEVRIIDVASGRATTTYLHRFVPSACGRLYLAYVNEPESVTGETSFGVATLDGEPVFEPAWGASSVLSANGKLRTYEDEDDASEACEAADAADVSAVVLSDSGELLTFARGTLWRGTRAVFAISFSIVAAAFDPLGRRLLCATEKRLLLLDVTSDAPSLVATYDLKPLHDQMASSRAQCSYHTLVAVLAKYGTLAEVAQRTAPELAEIVMRDAQWEEVPVPLAEAKKIVQMAKRARDLGVLPRR